MKQFTDRLWSLLHIPEGPLVPYLDPFAQMLDDQGFKRHLLGRQILVVAKFSQWLLKEKVDTEDVCDEHVQRFFEEDKQHFAPKRGEFACVRRFMDFLRSIDVLPLPPANHNITPIEKIVTEFAVYLRKQRELSERTVAQYCPFIAEFLSNRFGKENVELLTLRAVDVIHFVQQKAKVLRPARSKAMTTALRSFLQYLNYCGATQHELVVAVPTVPSWSMTGIPRAIETEHINAILAHCPRDTPIGRRDYAILMLLVHLGLRSCEIVSLTLDSIDWEKGSITVIGKGNDVASLPMLSEVGQSIADYLRFGRPVSSSRSLFLCACAPIRSLGASQTIGSIVGAAIKRANITTQYKGTHQFRHALATNLLRQGATLTEIGQVMRHKHTKTTGIYAKVDFVALRQLCLPWPGGVQ